MRRCGVAEEPVRGTGRLGPCTKRARRGIAGIFTLATQRRA
jgi:hypothetical protein